MPARHMARNLAGMPGKRAAWGRRPWGASLLGQRETVKHIARSERDELFSIDCVTHGRRIDGRAGLKTPQGLAGPRLKRDQIAVAAGGEEHAAAGGQYAGRKGAEEKLLFPHNVSRLRIDRFHAAPLLIWAGI